MVPIIASGGVTTSLILPGSTNIIGGQGLAIKNRVPESLSVVDMQVEYKIDQPQKHLKMACGFNPKAFHSDFHERPNSRMGIVCLIYFYFSLQFLSFPAFKLTD